MKMVHGMIMRCVEVLCTYCFAVVDIFSFFQTKPGSGQYLQMSLTAMVVTILSGAWGSGAGQVLAGDRVSVILDPGVADPKSTQDKPKKGY